MGSDRLRVSECARYHGGVMNVLRKKQEDDALKLLAERLKEDSEAHDAVNIIGDALDLYRLDTLRIRQRLYNIKLELEQALAREDRTIKSRDNLYGDVENLRHAVRFHSRYFSLELFRKPIDAVYRLLGCNWLKYDENGQRVMETSADGNA